MGIFSDVLLTVDYDRTLTDPNSVVPEENIRAIRYFMDNGGAFTVNTGRSVPMTVTFRDIVPVNAPLLLYNGGAAYDVSTGEVSQLHEIRLSQGDVVRRLMEMFPDMTVEVQGVKAHYQFTPNEMWVRFSEFSNCAHELISPDADTGPFIKFAVYGEIREPNVRHLFEGTREELDRITQAENEIRREFGDAVDVYRAAPRIIDVLAKGTSKGLAARALQKKLGRKILVCIGDTDNDIPMLDAADFAFCPSDGGLADRYPNVCECARGAVADVIYNRIPEILQGI